MQEREKIFRKVKKKTGFDPTLYRKTTLLRRLNYRIFKTGCRNFKEYLKYLDKHNEEYERFIQSLSINVTDFFRDKEVFNAIRKIVIPAVIGAKEKRKSIRILSMGCATGKEAYSIAILLSEVLKGSLAEYKIRIFATDINKDLLKIARDGKYPKDGIKEIKNKSLIKKYFREADGEFIINKNIRRMVTFIRHNVITGDIIKNCDIILCRNLLIFFSPELQKKIYIKLSGALAKGGFLILGTAETPPDIFYPVCKKEHIYKLEKHNTKQ